LLPTCCCCCLSRTLHTNTNSDTVVLSFILNNMSAGSGILPTSDTLAVVDELRKNNSKWVFGLFKVSGSEIIPDTQYEAKSGANFEKDVWPAFVKALDGAGGPRFAVIDFSYKTKDERQARTLTSIGWCPDKGVPAKEKMTFASTKTAFEAKINLGKKYQANDESDLEYQTVLDFVSQGK